MKDRWYLAGGTALSLQVGHRESVDLDFFTHEKSFDERKIIEQFDDAGAWQVTSVDRGTVYGEFLGAKLSLIVYPTFTPVEPMWTVGCVSIISPPDIAAMKVVAISQRGRKRDFFDLYWLSKNELPLNDSIQRAKEQYSVKQNINHILKSLVYFVDAEDDPNPELHFQATWLNVKDFFEEEISRIAGKIIGV